MDKGSVPLANRKRFFRYSFLSFLSLSLITACAQAKSRAVLSDSTNNTNEKPPVLVAKENKSPAEAKPIAPVAAAAPAVAIAPTTVTDPAVAERCEKTLNELPGSYDAKKVKAACEKVVVLEGCQSVGHLPIYHFEKRGPDSKKGLNVLVISLIHGDEPQSGSVARNWMARLTEIESRNNWRIIPVANPDGLIKKSRTNSNGVDLNRNFPTSDWKNSANNFWRKTTSSNKRRFPGKQAASEIETQCALSHIEDFNPHFIISIHTPLGILDFDGPKLKSPPKHVKLPWSRVGNFPGSLGRYMWRDGKVPVLTIELKGENSVRDLDEIDHLQDISGLIAIMANSEKLAIRDPHEIQPNEKGKKSKPTSGTF
jgi:protein MpaA